MNLARQSPATHMLVVRHRDRPGVLAHVFEQLHDAGINVQETENIVFEGAEAAVARINLDHAPTADLARRDLGRQRAHPERASSSPSDAQETPSVTERIYNFSSGPAVLPLPVLEQAQRDLVALPGVGMSVMEISHRSSTFEGIIGKAEADIRRLAGIPDDYQILFLQGGATLQFSMVPINLLTEGRTADYIMTGTWADKAVKEARRVGNVHETGLDRRHELQPDPDRRRAASSRRARPTST